MKSVKTLVDDIYSLFRGENKFSPESVSAFAEGLSKRIAAKLSEERQRGRLRLSNLGSRCDRKLWYSVRRPEAGAPLPPYARIKFLFGDILEEMLLWLAREAGHKVEREQEEVKLHGVTGHIDAVVDGELVDCKSVSTYSFNKFKERTLASSDDFGYLTQLDSYLHATPDIGDTGHFLAIDKQLGHIVLDSYDKTKTDYGRLVARKKEMLDFPSPPARGFSDEPEGASGNRKLCTACSYCEFNKECWPGLRTFMYAKKPVSLTVVKRLPNVPEIK